MYGLAVLLALELGRPVEAGPLLAGVLEREPKNVEALFLLGRIAYVDGRYEDAVDAFDRVSPPGRRADRGAGGAEQAAGKGGAL